jgi:hypothetical protein
VNRTLGSVAPKNVAERKWNTMQGMKDIHTENGASKGHNRALTGLFVQSSLGNGG